MMIVGGGKYADGWNEAQKAQAAYLRKERTDKEMHEGIVTEIEKATEKKRIVVDGEEYYVDKNKLKLLIKN